MAFVLIIHATVLLTITAQKNLTPFGRASQISTIAAGKTEAINAIQPPISNTFSSNSSTIIYCTHTTGFYDSNPMPAWWMFEFSFESAYITEIQIYYREGQALRMDGFKLYVTNISTIPPDGYLCYEDPDPGLPNITQTIPCNQLGKYVIYYDDKGSDHNMRYIGPIVELCYVAINDGTTTEGYHTVYASNTSNKWTSGTVLYNGTSLPNEIKFQSVFRFLTYVPPVGNQSSELELCEIGIIGCPPTHYGPLCNITCPLNCKGPCDLDVGYCTFGCINGWTGIRCEQVCHDGFYGKECLEICSATCLNSRCHHATGKCIGGCKDGWQTFNCSQECPYGQFGRNCSEFCDGCIARMCNHINGLCDNASACDYGYKYSPHCNIACDDGNFGNDCANRCFCLTEPCNKNDGICPPSGCREGWYGESCNKDGTQSRHKETSNAAAIGGAVAAFIVVLILVAALIVYKRRCISTQDGVRTKSNDATTYENSNTTNNSNRNEPHYDDLIRMDPASTYQDLTSHSEANEYEQIDNTYVNQSLQI
ncbi:multiple epidermal growth factor-like domains protein 10 [Mytilus trossulus]|uniref:multiple epidermal growth factor-like domains protein 10 n=1 Tax=Mytilus trossulus TaxID=6551 RepID=UPI003005551F